jgi:hypothetical protein
MIEEHPSSQLLKQYSERILPPDLFLVVHDHIMSCARCHEECGAPINLSADYENIRSALMPEPGEEPPPHLSVEEVRGYLNKTLGEIDLEIAESHLEFCQSCRVEIEKLRRPDARALAEPVFQGTAAGAAFRRKVLPRIPYWPVRWRSMRAITVALLIGCLLTALVLVLMRSGRGDRTNQLPPLVRENGVENQNSQASVSAPTPAEVQRTDEQTQENRVVLKPPSIVDERRASDSPRLVFTLADGERQVSADAAGRVRGLEGLPEQLRQAVATALLAQKLERPQGLDGLDGKASTLLSESEGVVSFQLLSPVSTVVESDRPTLRWLPLDGASTYTVVIVDASLNEVVTSEPLSATEWKVRAALKRGALYSWQVTAVRGDRRIVSPALPAPQAKFKILDEAQADELMRMRRSFSGSHLALGVLYTQEGMLDEAEQEFISLVVSNPRSVVARRLLESVRSMKKRA